MNAADESLGNVLLVGLGAVAIQVALTCAATVPVASAR